MSVLSLNKTNFDQAIASKKPVLVDFYADWCGPCRLLSPVIHELAAENSSEAQFYKVNVDHDSELAQRFKVMSIPTVLIFKNGKLIGKEVGVRPKTVYENHLSQ